MNKKFLSFYFFMFCLTIFIGCGKKTNQKLAQNFYKQAVLELNEDNQSKQACRRAIYYIDEALRCAKDPRYLALKATLLFKLNQVEEGQRFFAKALNNTSAQDLKAEILNNNACLLAQVGLKRNNKEKIDSALSIWSDLEDNVDYFTPEVAVINQGKVYFEQNNYEKAKKKLIKAIKLSPNFIDAHYYLSVIAYKLKDYNLAKDEIKTIVFLEPNHYGAHELGKLLEKK